MRRCGVLRLGGRRREGVPMHAYQPGLQRGVWNEIHIDSAMEA